MTIIIISCFQQPVQWKYIYFNLHVQFAELNLAKHYVFLASNPAMTYGETVWSVYYFFFLFFFRSTLLLIHSIYIELFKLRNEENSLLICTFQHLQCMFIQLQLFFKLIDNMKFRKSVVPLYKCRLVCDLAGLLTERISRN